MFKTRSVRIRTKRLDAGYRLWIAMLVVVAGIQCLRIYWMDLRVTNPVKLDNLVMTKVKDPEPEPKPVKVPETVRIKHGEFETLINEAIR